ncbi:hypothetical protein B0J12DRAFT_160796 [Macrophomina phaseolina]|uniref:Uncharacterized protein n=1 Tax=Macrophomina phaseolina TaxID=35725 RepID=A0ABQ8GRS0_9PEZI|nr:hypothetical protein B0J12DRAFT_160796 [Macrophomina phaseolina]
MHRQKERPKKRASMPGSTERARGRLVRVWRGEKGRGVLKAERGSGQGGHLTGETSHQLSQPAPGEAAAAATGSSSSSSSSSRASQSHTLALALARAHIGPTTAPLLAHMLARPDNLTRPRRAHHDPLHHLARRTRQPRRKARSASSRAYARAAATQRRGRVCGSRVGNGGGRHACCTSAVTGLLLSLTAPEFRVGCHRSTPPIQLRRPVNRRGQCVPRHLPLT